MTVDHWERIYTTRPTDGVGWYEPDPVISRRLVEAAVARGARSVIDIGGGASSLVDHLLELGLDRIAVLDIAGSGLAVSRARLGPRADDVEWIVADVTAPDRPRPVRRLARPGRLPLPARPGRASAIRRAGAPDGPARRHGDHGDVRGRRPRAVQRPPGLPLRARGARPECGPAFRLTSTTRHLHHTPLGVPQAFQYSTFERVARRSRVGPGRLGARAPRQPQPERSRRSIRLSCV